jgi:hypothetical protein
MDSGTKSEHARRLLERIDVLRDPCDLDLLMFFVKHPRTLMASEQLATFLGYNLKRIAKSLDVLLSAGLLSRSQHPTHAARMYVFAIGGSGSGGLPALLEFAATRDGRLALRLALRSQSAEDPERPATGVEPEAMRPASRRPYLVQPRPRPDDEDAEPKARRKGTLR